MSAKRPTTKPVATEKRGKATYSLFADGQLWTGGQARAEFGL